MGGALKPTRKPSVPTIGDPHPVPRQAARLREIHAELSEKGYGRVLVAPATHPELLEEFLGLAPSAPRDLDEALRDFYVAIGLPTLPKRLIRAGQTPTTASRGPSRAEAASRALAHGSAIVSPRRRSIGWRVTADAVRLQVGAGGEALSHGEVVELQAALTAWLRLNPAPGSATAPKS